MTSLTAPVPGPSPNTYQVRLVHAVEVWSNDAEVLDALRRRGVRYVDGHLDVVANRAEFALERARQRALGQLELEPVALLAARHDPDWPVVMLV